ncbi:MAG: 16S rRNA (guanine(527)-N(7))-methyltransferase RsmG, partial [Salinisphaera sp.]|nr:16S rRNA (guanine(527)-N(7))-methyltransferase RsmG [Salinisphaera sp.]
HLLDSLAALPGVQGGRVADIGSGAGLPGIPIALARPAKSMILVESNGKKAAFLRHAARVLALDNVSVVQDRVESFHPSEPFTTVVCRAFAAAGETLYRCGHLCVGRGRVVLLKGRDPTEELAKLPAGFRVATVESVCVPGLGAERHVAVVEPGLL